MNGLKRLAKIFTVPAKLLFAALYPVRYAKWLGVRLQDDLVIYGTSYYMFSTEPYLVTLGKNVFISVGAKFVCHDGSTLPFRKTIPDLELAGEIKVGDNVFIGMEAMILKGVTIGSDCVIGARAVVTKDVPAGSIVAGNPARIVKSSAEFLEQAKSRSLKIGHLYGREKVLAYKRIFNKL